MEKWWKKNVEKEVTEGSTDKGSTLECGWRDEFSNAEYM